MLPRALLVAVVVVVGVPDALLAQRRPVEQQLPSGWTECPCTAPLGAMATLSIPAGYYYLDREATATFQTENENVSSPDELGSVVHVGADGLDWFAIFSYADSGHIEDSERDSLDADAILASLREGNEAGNRVRRQHGWEELRLDGWFRRPYYDRVTNNLTWAVNAASSGGVTINHSVRLLGRTGFMSAHLVCGASEAQMATTQFDELLRGFSFNAGHRYAEFRKGDKLATYGLTALVTGGAVAVAAKSGLLQKFGKFLILLAVGAVAGLRRLWASFAGGRRRAVVDTPPSSPTGGEWH